MLRLQPDDNDMITRLRQLHEIQSDALSLTERLLHPQGQQTQQSPPIVPNLPSIDSTLLSSLNVTENESIGSTLSSLSETQTKLDQIDSRLIAAASAYALHEETQPTKTSSPPPSNKRPKNESNEHFPVKLYRMLIDCEHNGLSDVVSFFPHGRAFAVHNPQRFVEEIMPKYFHQSRLTSFQRQLNLYEYQRIKDGVDKGGYYHKMFLKGRPDLCDLMKRIKSKKCSEKKENEPDFYNMPSITKYGDQMNQYDDRSSTPNKFSSMEGTKLNDTALLSRQVPENVHSDGSVVKHQLFQENVSAATALRKVYDQYLRQLILQRKLEQELLK